MYYIFISLNITLYQKNWGKWEQLTWKKQYFCTFLNMSCEFSACSKNELAFLSQDFPRIELLYNEQDVFPHC